MKLELALLRQYGNLELLARQMVEGFITGLHKSPYHGFSVEFAEHKIYNPGESTRNIDWKVFAKTDRLYTKRFEEETNLRARLVLDASASMYYPSQTRDKLVFASIASACLAYMLQRQRDAVGLTTFAAEIEDETAIKSTTAHLQKLLTTLSTLTEAEPKPGLTSLSKVLHEVAERTHQRSLIMIMTDLLDHADDQDLFGALQHLKHNKHEVLLFHIADRNTELELNFDTRPYEFVDAETGDKLKLVPAQLQAQYREAMLNFRNEISLRCHQYKIDFIEADVNGGIDQVLLPYLVKRSKMR